MTKTILDKLGWASGKAGAAHNVPEDLSDIFAPVISQAGKGRTIWSIWFVVDVNALNACARTGAEEYLDGGHLWFAYPKLSGKIKTDITRDKGWAVLEAYTLMPVTQIAIDATWSALRFRRRHEIKKLTRKI